MYPTVNLALFIATTCRDGPFPWEPETPLAARPKLVTAAIAALPDGAMGPFGRWVSRNGNAQACVGWPSPKGGAALGRGPLPDVPVLALSGELDLRTPTADAASVVSRFPHGHLLVVPGTGHSVLSSPSECAASAVSDWLDGKPVPKRCPAVHAYLDPIAAFPTATAAPATPAGPPRTLELVAENPARGRGDVAADRAERRSRRGRSPAAARSRPATTRSRSSATASSRASSSAARSR